MSHTSTDARWTLRDLPFAARFTIAVFLVSVGIGYFSALINLHFQTATPGEPLPTSDDVLRDYVGTSKTSQIERLLLAHPSLPFNGQGSMRSVFTKQRASGWEKERRKRAAELKVPKGEWKDLAVKNPKLSKEIDKYVAQLFDGERLALIAWLRDGAAKEPYEADAFELTGSLNKLVITPRMAEVAADGVRSAKIKSIMEARCVRCHSENVGGGGAQFPLQNFDDLAIYTQTEKSTGKSLSKLAMTTHVHLLGFSMLYGLTGIIFALTGYWGWLRLGLAPLPLLAQVVDISFWWLARLDEPHGSMFAKAIPISGGVVALGVGLQILLTLFYLFGKFGKVVLLMLVFAAIGAGFGVKDKVFQYLENEKTAAGIESIAKE